MNVARRAWIAVRVGTAGALSVVLAGCGSPPGAERQEAYDLVILNGRVMDPASGLDAIRSVGGSGESIRAVSEEGLQGQDTLDARGLVVAPGFIDLHQHAHE